MSKSFIFFSNPWDRNDATYKYMDIIACAFKKAGYEDRGLTNSLDEIGASDTIVTINCAFGAKASLLKPKNRIVHWFQGVEPEERRFLHGGTKGELQYLLWNVLERIVARKADHCIFVSSEMLQHYEQKHKVQSSGFIMPCYNAAFDERNIASQNKCRTMNLVYAGSMHPWQRVADVLAIFREIQKLNSDARLTLLTRELDTARKLSMEQGVSKVDIRSVPAERIAEELAQFSCGFILRNEMLINEVSTPTKLSSYLAAGVMPVITTATPALGRMIEDTKYKLVLNPKIDPLDAAKKILDLHKSLGDPADLVRDYKTIFENHFDDRKYAEKLATLVNVGQC
jgi:glycosyltransferase involved in cell wall biosynthesis